MSGMQQVQEVALSQELEQRLRALLDTILTIKVDYDLLEEQLDAEKAKVFAALKEEGVTKAQIDEIKLSIVGGDNRKLDKQKFVSLGGDLQMLEDATRVTPKKEYVLVTFPKDRRKEYETE